MNHSAGPLDGVRILDLCSVVSGPMSAVMLADQGADVIKVEPPGWGDGIRGLGAQRNGVSAIFSMINRNKRSVGINLKHPEGAAIATKLAATCDVVMQNYRPGKIDKLGLGYEDLKQHNPDLIYASINGMGEVGPYAEQRVFDYVIQGISGVIDAQSQDQPQMVRSIIFDKVTALIAAQGITAALFARANGAGGQHIKLSMLDAGVYFNWPDLMWNYSFISPSPQGEQTEDAQVGGGDVHYARDLADMYEISQTSDGAIVSHSLGADTSQYSTDQLVELLAANEIAVAKVNSRADVITDPQVIATGVLEQFDHPIAGKMRQPRPPVQFEGTPTQHRHTSPEVGEHTVEVLQELGMEIEQMQALARQGAIG